MKKKRQKASNRIMSKKKNTRASNGMGSIRQRSDGRWEARYTAPDGRQRSVYARTEKEVTAKLRGVQHELDSGAWREPSKMTVADWLEIWLNDYQGHNSERTILKYRCIVNVHIVPKLGEIKVSKVLPLHVRRLINEMQASGLAPVTIKNYVRIFGAAMNSAIEAGLIKSNPTEGAKMPRVSPTKFHIVDRADIPAFIAAAQNTPYPNELIFMLFSGLRVGEARGLRWADIDFDAATMHVQRQLHPNNHNVRRFTSPKYGEDRIVHLPAEAVNILREQRRRQAEQRIAAGGWDDTDITRDLVFRMKNGNAHTDRSIYKAVKAAGAEIGMPELHPHDLRHSYAVAALRSGADVKTVQHNLGHKTAAMTLDVYAAYTEDAGRATADKLSEYLKNT